MDVQTIRLLVRQKLRDGRLPSNRADRFWARAGAGEMCDACESAISKDQMAVEGFASRITHPEPLRVHAGCYQIWDAERSAPSA